MEVPIVSSSSAPCRPTRISGRTTLADERGHSLVGISFYRQSDDGISVPFGWAEDRPSQSEYWNALSNGYYNYASTGEPRDIGLLPWRRRAAKALAAAEDLPLRSRRS